MLIAKESFIDPTDGGAIMASRTRVAPDADVALMFPERFRRDPDTSGGWYRFVRDGGSATVSATAGIKRTTSGSAPLPKLFAELEPVEAIELGHKVAATIFTDIAWTEEHLGRVETGGWLVGLSRSYIMRATVPGSDSVATRSSINLGLEQLEAVQRQHGEALLGCWHFEPGGDGVPSDQDLRSWAAGARLTGDRWISLICCPSRTWRPEPAIFGWQTVRLPNGQMLTERLRVEH
jgi:hypothetical protein